MNKLRILSVGLAITAAFVLVSGSLGFTSTAVDRGVSVAVADDSQAFVGYESNKDLGGLNATEDHEVELVQIENRLGQDVHVTEVILESGDDHVVDFEDIKKPQISTGHEEWITAELQQCTPGDGTEVFVTVTVKGDSVEATLFGDSDRETVERSFTVTCEEESNNGAKGNSGNKLVKYNGQGGAQIKADGPRRATVRYVDTDGKYRSESGMFESNQNLKNQLDRKTRNQNPICSVTVDGDNYPNDNPCEAD